MKLHPPTDPGKVFDDLSVLAIKCAKTSGSAPAVANLSTYSVPISGELGDRYGTSLYGQIVESPEYANLYSVNLRLFDLIDHMSGPERDPSQCYDVAVDGLNRDRWRAKAALQQRFWPDAPLSEQKVDRGVVAPLPFPTGELLSPDWIAPGCRPRPRS
jgi:hypothetical protein